MQPYEYYNAIDGEDDHVHVERLDDNGDWVHWSRIAEHGVNNIIKDKGWSIAREGWVDTARFVYNWGRGPVVTLTNGEASNAD